MKKILFTLLLALPFAALASESADLGGLAIALFGEQAGQIIGAIALVGYIWAQVRQLIPAQAIAKLPKPIIWILELAAANKYQSENSFYNDPNHHKTIKNSKL